MSDELAFHIKPRSIPRNTRQREARHGEEPAPTNITPHARRAAALKISSLSTSNLQRVDLSLVKDRDFTVEEHSTMLGEDGCAFPNNEPKTSDDNIYRLEQDHRGIKHSYNTHAGMRASLDNDADADNMSDVEADRHWEESQMRKVLPSASSYAPLADTRGFQLQDLAIIERTWRHEISTLEVEFDAQMKALKHLRDTQLSQSENIDLDAIRTNNLLLSKHMDWAEAVLDALEEADKSGAHVEIGKLDAPSVTLAALRQCIENCSLGPLSEHDYLSLIEAHFRFVFFNTPRVAGCADALCAFARENAVPASLVPPLAMTLLPRLLSLAPDAQELVSELERLLPDDKLEAVKRTLSFM